jgi:hypothetical protein
VQTSHDAYTSTISVQLALNQGPTIVSGPTASPSTFYWPNTTTVSVSASDPDNGPSPLTYTWSGASGVTFSPNGTSASSVSTVSFGTPGTYNLYVTISDGAISKQGGPVVVTVMDPDAVIAPSNLSASTSSKTVTLNWNDNSNNEDGFYVERALKPKGNTSPTFSRVGQVGANTRTYSQTVGAGTYLYRVQGFNLTTGKVSSYSNSTTCRVR